MINAETPEEFIAEHQRMKDLVRLGMSVTEIATKYDCREQTIKNYLKRPIGWLPRQVRMRALRSAKDASRKAGGDARTHHDNTGCNQLSTKGEKSPNPTTLSA